MTYSLDELKGMIPIYLNGRLTASETAAFEAGLRQHPELEAELKDFSAIKESYDVLEDPPEIDSEALFARIQKGIHGDAKPVTDHREEGPFRHLMSFLRRIYHTPSLSWSMAGLQFAALLLVFLVIPRHDVFKTYSSTATSDTDKVYLNVVFDKEAKEIEIRTLLQKLGAGITSGPSAEGLYVLAGEKTADIDALLKALKASPIVRLAEKKMSRLERKREFNEMPVFAEAATAWR